MEQPANEGQTSVLTWRNLILAVAILGAISVVLYLWLPEPQETDESLDISQVITYARAGKVQRILVDGDSLTVDYVAETGTSGVSQKSTLPEAVDLPELLRSEGIAISGDEGEASPTVSLEYAEQSEGLSGVFTFLINIL